MKIIQLKAERIMSTGDNSFVEAVCAGCQLLLYENVANDGCKHLFLQQQIGLANLFSPTLSKLLEIFGTSSTITNWSEEIEVLLSDPDLTASTMNFCKYITQNYSFEEVVEASIKRSVWTFLLPSLSDIEIKYINDDFKTGIIQYLRLKSETFTPQHIFNEKYQLSDISRMKIHLQQNVFEYFM